MDAELILAVVALALIHIVGARRARTDADYFVAGRTVGTMPLALSVASGIVGGGVLMVYGEYVYRFGWTALWIIGGLLLGLVMLDPVARLLKPVADKFECVSLPDLVGVAAGRTAAYCASAVVLVWTGAFIVMQLISGGLLLNVLTGIRYEYGVVIAGALVLTYLLRGGMQSVVRTDILQYAVLGLLFLVATVPATTSLARTPITLPSMDAGSAAGFLILGALNVVVSADLWMRMYAARSVGAARKSLVWAGVFVLALSLLATMPALYAVATKIAVPPNQAFIAALRVLLPNALFGLAIAGTICIVLAALDTMLFVFGVAGANDIASRADMITPLRRRRWVQIVMICAFMAGVAVAMRFRELLMVGLALSSVGLALVPITTALLWHTRKGNVQPRVSGRSAVGSLALGTVAVLLLPLVTPLTPETALVSLPAAIAGWFVGWLLDRFMKTSARRHE